MQQQHVVLVKCENTYILAAVKCTQIYW